MKSRVALLLGAAIFANSSIATAEEAEVSDEKTIVVTATRNEQSKEQVPASIAVQDVEQLRRDGFTFGTEE